MQTLWKPSSELRVEDGSGSLTENRHGRVDLCLWPPRLSVREHTIYPPSEKLVCHEVPYSQHFSIVWDNYDPDWNKLQTGNVQKILTVCGPVFALKYTMDSM